MCGPHLFVFISNITFFYIRGGLSKPQQSTLTDEPHSLPMMEKYNVPPQELEQAGQLLVQVMDLLAAQSSAKSREQELTKQRNEQVEALRIWMRQFMKVAEVALSESPQQMEALGKVVA